jgi:hypothetical protein
MRKNSGAGDEDQTRDLRLGKRILRFSARLISIEFF